MDIGLALIFGMGLVVPFILLAHRSTIIAMTLMICNVCGLIIEVDPNGEAGWLIPITSLVIIGSVFGWGLMELNWFNQRGDGSDRFGRGWGRG